MLRIIAILLLSAHGLRAMDFEEASNRFTFCDGPITIKIFHHIDLAHSLANNCPCPKKITEESFATSYHLWEQVNALDSKAKNELLQKILDEVNSNKYQRLRGGIACLICAGADVEQSCTHFKDDCALKYAAIYQDLTMAKLLLKKGADANRKRDIRPLFFYLQSVRFVKLFVKYNLNPHIKDSHNNSIFHTLTGWPEYPPSLISCYIKLGVDIHHKNVYGDTALMQLALNSSNYCSNIEIGQLFEKAKLFVENGISITETNELNRNALDLLARALRSNSKGAYALKTFLENYSSDPVEEISHLFYEHE